MSDLTNGITTTRTITATNTKAAAPADFSAAPNMLQLAEAIKNSSFIPEALRGDAGNAFLAIELANRTGLPLMATLQGMYVIERTDRNGNKTSSGKPSFYANFVHALIRKSGAFVDTYYEEGTDGTAAGQPNRTCRLVAIRQDGTEVKGPVISIAMAQKAGWISRNNAIWSAYAQTMLQNRAVTFFARQCCPELIFGIDPDADIRAVPDEDAAPAESLKERLAAYKRPEPIADAQADDEAPRPRRGRPRKATPAPEAAPEAAEAAAEQQSEYSAYLDAIAAAQNKTDLNAIGAEIGQFFNGTDEETDALREAFRERDAELAE